MGRFHVTRRPRDARGLAGLTLFLLASLLASAQTADTLTVDPSASSLIFNVEVDADIVGSASDEDTSAVSGVLLVEGLAGGAPFGEIRIVDLQLALADDLALSLAFGGFITVGRINVESDADSIQLSMVTPGAPTTVTSDQFSQPGNELQATGRIRLEGTGLLSTLVPPDTEYVDVTSTGDLSGLITQQDTLIEMAAPVEFSGEFDLQDGVTVTVTLTGTIVASGPVPAVPTAFEEDPSVAGFRLEQNAPNPVRSATRIRYTMPEAGPVQLTVFDVQGRRVAVPVDAVQEAGPHEVTIETAQWPAGVYLYRLRVGDRVETRRMVVLR